MTTLYVMAATLILAPFYGQALRWHDQVKARRVAEMERLTAPLPAPRLNLTDQYVLTPIGSRWPQRQSPDAYASARGDIPWREGPVLALDTPAPAPLYPEPVQEQATIGDRYACDDPCTARHCIHHAGIIGSIAQRFRWNTDTAEFSLLGLTVPDFPPLRPAFYSEGT